MGGGRGPAWGTEFPAGRMTLCVCVWSVGEGSSTSTHRGKPKAWSLPRASSQEHLKMPQAPGREYVMLVELCRGPVLGCRDRLWLQDGVGGGSGDPVSSCI